ncbi:uncharacterized protein BDZ99DRAFT_126070 [Mytilinidion resinicola]|uniref:dihydroneopterin aldolase n=1 Tax=Mytilinidion resinicola TaxID=574789 RepID=A0A6A6Z458_9PEZI|nr:uncharacterized protein BDZ99DRAFT_126070 [Mytilinidion resinicola]KAF2815932.1 hypothetical protein BDZ99DRAFT_126070 [Mytilinidion resinicola]
MALDPVSLRRFSHHISHKEWKSAVENADKISVRNLSVTSNSGLDVWGRQKRQPALLSITAFLAHTFDQAAQSDAVDSSTVHYGILSKSLQGVIENSKEWQSTFTLARDLNVAAYSIAAPGTLIGCELDIFYPKACMQGDGAGYIISTTDEGIFATLYLKSVRIPCLIGVNSNERQAKQPVIANLWIENVHEAYSDAYNEAEKILIQTVESSSFETLESLATQVVADLRKQIFLSHGTAAIRLRLEKPMAVPFADAPSIEIYRAASGGS